MPDTSPLPNFNLKTELIRAGNHNRPGTHIHPTYVTIHNTDNTDKGADAEAHSRFVRQTGYYLLRGEKNWVSWHFTVDDGVAIKHVPANEKAYHAGPGNSVSVAIEVCMNEGIDQAAANKRAAELTAGLLKDLGIKADDIRPHHAWTGKDCPVLLLDHAIEGEKWKSFVGLVEAALDTLKDAKGLIVLEPGELEAIARIPARGFDESVDTDTEEIDHQLVAEQLNLMIQQEPK